MSDQIDARYLYKLKVLNKWLRVAVAQLTNFTGGELSPRLDGRN